jgi:dTDP-4-amino-4,6-dideoxygalactose transaminase
MIPIFSDAVISASLDFGAVIQRVLDRHAYVLGAEVAGFETEFAEYLGVRQCVTVANGTDALELALRGVGVAPGDHVVTVANAGFYASTAVRQVGAIPVYVDVAEDDLTMDVDELREALAAKPKAVVLTHLYGKVARVESVADLCRRSGVALIEDCAQAHGASRDGVKVGAWGDVACFSFYPTKNLGALGDGGALATNNEELAARLRGLRQYGWKEKYHVEWSGGRNSRLDEMQAAILRDKLPHLDAWNAQRRAVAARYSAAWDDLPVICPRHGEGDVAHLYVVRVRERETLRTRLRALGVATDVHYPVPDHLQTPARGASVAIGALPVTTAACAEVLTLPCYPGMQNDEIDTVVGAVRAGMV